MGSLIKPDIVDVGEAVTICGMDACATLIAEGAAVGSGIVVPGATSAGDGEVSVSNMTARKPSSPALVPSHDPVVCPDMIIRPLGPAAAASILSKFPVPS